MNKFILSAFADEYSSNFDLQLEGLLKNGMTHIELRGVDGKNILDLTEEELEGVKAKLEKSGIKISAIGSPLGKIDITDPFEEHLEKTKKCVELANYLGTPNIRMFSFYIKDGDFEGHRDEVIRRLGAMLDIADEGGVLLCHENEKGIYGDTPERCLDLLNEFGGRLKCIFDPANFLQCGEESYPRAFELLCDKIYYMHIKDADATGSIVPAGAGEGRIPDMLRSLASGEAPYILTLEPHLTVFEGLAALEDGEKTKHAYEFSSTEEAFNVGAEALRRIIAEL